MAYKPFMIPGFSGVHFPEKKTCVIMINSTYAALLEDFARPSVMIGFGCEIKADQGQYLRSVRIENHPIEEISVSALVAFAVEKAEEFNVILHIDEVDILNPVLRSGLFARGTYSLAITTGADRPITIENFREELDLPNVVIGHGPTVLPASMDDVSREEFVEMLMQQIETAPSEQALRGMFGMMYDKCTKLRCRGLFADSSLP